VDEQEFWRRLEFRICAEFAGFADRQLRFYWCDGLVPDDYDLTGAEPHVSGVAYCGQSGQERWRFTLEARGVLSSGLSTASLRSGVMYRWAGTPGKGRGTGQ